MIGDSSVHGQLQVEKITPKLSFFTSEGAELGQRWGMGRLPETY